MKTILSKQFSLQWRDLLRGLIIAVVSAVLTALLQSLEAGDVTVDWTSMYRVGALAGVSYVLKNFLEPAKVITTTTNAEAIATKAVVKEAVKSE